jgi:hypothetical protein
MAAQLVVIPSGQRMSKDRTENKYWMGLLFIAVALTFIQVLDLYKDIKSRSWPTTEGDIYLNYYPTPPRFDQVAGYVMGPTLGKEISFSYIIAGCLYSSTNTSFGFTFSEDFEFLKPVFRDHVKVKVYFNPHDPSEAVLMPGPKMLSIVLMLLGALSMYWLLKQITKS